MLVLFRTAAFFVVGLVVAFAYDWSWFEVGPVVLTGAASTVQLGGVLWLRWSERRAVAMGPALKLDQTLLG
ncbi:hypothetical protein GCM10027597_19100 [Saccharopolyspora tripterygii]